MPTKEFCIEAVAKAAGIGRQEAAAIVKELADWKKNAEADGALLTAAQVAEEAERRGNDAMIRAALEKKNAALSIVKRKEIKSRVDTLVNDSGFAQEDALLAIIEGSAKRGTQGGSFSVFTRYESNKAKYMNSVLSRLKQAKIDVWRRIRSDKEFNHNIVREMWEIRTDGKGNPGVTKDADAKYVAEVLADVSKQLRLRLNENGAYIRKLQGWSPQSHDSWMLQSAGEDAWISDIKPLLDFDSMGVSPEDRDNYLSAAYHNIVMGQQSKNAENLTPAGIAKKYGKSRKLHFKDATAQTLYQEKYGKGVTVLDNILGHIERATRDLALMETFGPNPEASFSALIKDYNQARTTHKKIKLDSFKTRSSRLGMAFAEVTGETMTPENVNLANVGRVIRAQQNLSKLGMAAVSAFGDSGLFAMERRTIVDEKSALGAWHETLKAIAKKNSKEDKMFSARLGVVLDMVGAQEIQRYNPEDPAYGRLARWQSNMFNWTGLTGWTNKMKTGFAILLSKDLGEGLGKPWNDLGEGFRELLAQNGSITRQEWELLGTVKPETLHGVAVFTPDMSAKLSSKDVAKAYGLDAKDKNAINMKRAELETKIRAMFIETTRNAVIEPDAKTRRWMVHGTKPGTTIGEGLRFFSQFKSYMFSYMQRVYGGKRWRKAGRNSDIAGFAMLMANSIAVGYVAMTLKDMAKGKLPRDPKNVETIVAALMQSGGMGIYGDFFLSDFNRFGGSIGSTFGGPTLGTVEDIGKLTQKLLRGDPDIRAESLRLAQSNLPFVNMWMTKAALDYLIWNNLKEMVSPGAMRRMEKRMKKDYNQEYIFPPSQNILFGR